MANTLTRRQIIAAGAATFLATLPITQAQGEPAEPTLSFKGKTYVLRAAQNGNLFIFTPTDQPDLQTSTDMFSILAYDNVKNFMQLRLQKNQIMGTFKQPGSTVFTDKDAPPAADFGGECFFVAGKAGRGATDADFARFTLASGIGYALIYERTEYDTASPNGNSAQALGNWINTKGSDVANALLAFTIVLNQKILQSWTDSLPKNTQ